MNAHNALLDAVPSDWDDEITTQHRPDPALLKQARSHSGPTVNNESGVTQIRRPPPLPRRAQIKILPIDRLRALLERLTECAGPAARPMVLAEIQALQATPERFPLLLGGQLIASLAARLDDPTTRQSFVSDARRILEEA